MKSLSSMKKTVNRGFTLIEVLIALAILAISLTAIIHAANVNIKSSQRLRDITIGEWVLDDALSFLRLGIIKPQASQTTQQTTMANKTLKWQAQLNPSKKLGLEKAELKVFFSNDDFLETQALISVSEPRS